MSLELLLEAVLMTAPDAGKPLLVYTCSVHKNVSTEGGS